MTIFNRECIYKHCLLYIKFIVFHIFRDDDNDRSDDDEDDRVDFSMNNAARERQQMRDKFLAVEHGECT